MSKEKNNPIKQEKLRKRLELISKGLDPYPHSWNKSRTSSSELNTETLFLDTEKVQKTTFHLAGRLMRKRPMGKAAFFNIQDEEGEFQCYIRRDDFSPSEIPEDSNLLLDKNISSSISEPMTPWRVWKLCDIGDILGLSGKVFKTKKGELSLRVEDLTILCKSVEALPEKYHGIEDKELKYRYRHLDLIMNPESRKTFKIRSQIIQKIREFMYKKNFIEVETPVLQSLYGGAEAQPFETYFIRLNKQMYLKISPEIYLKKLIVGGFERVFEIGKNFRNEGIDRTHNPEFTMMEYYQAYTDYQDQMKQFEELICFVVQEIKGSLKFNYQGKELDFTPPWKRMSVKEAVKKHGNIDPDKQGYKALLDFVKSLDPQGDIKRFEESTTDQEDLKDELILLAFELTVEKQLWNPTFITDFPLVVSPLTKKHRNPDSPRIVERFEPYIAGMELGNAYTELNDPIDQRNRLEKQKRSSKVSLENKKEKNQELTHHPIDENFLHALEVGMPPTGGVGLGIERLVMILTDQASIRDVILFPVLKDKN